MVRTTVGTIAEAELSVQQQKQVTTISADQTATVSAGNNQDTLIKAPSGSTISVVAASIRAPAPSGASSGRHQVQLSGPDAAIRYLTAGSDFGDQIFIRESVIDTATGRVRPGTDAAQASTIRALTADDTQGLNIRYQNDTDVDQTQTRRIRLVTVQEGVSN
jgi:hypothetical protein